MTKKKLAKKKATTRRKTKRKPAQSKKRSSIKIIGKKSRSAKKKTSKKATSKRTSTRQKQNGNLRRGGPGRPKGSENKATKEARALSRDIVQDKTYLKKLATRVKAGKAQKIEVLLWHYAFGVPKQPFKLEGDDGKDIHATVLEAIWRDRDAESSTVDDS